MNPAASAPSSFEFGSCRVLLHRRELLCGGHPVALGGRAFEILVALIEGRGAVVAKDELMRLAWPGRIVEENTLEAQVSALRRALGEDRHLIRTIAGRGYQFIGEIRAGAAAAVEPAGNARLPASITPLIGREAALREIVELAATQRLITLVGAGGVGKTRLALEAAGRVAPLFPDGVSLAELGPLGAPEFVPAAVAQALGFPQGAGTPSLDRIASAISTRRMLLVLDNCEHLVEAAAQIVEKLLHAGAFASVIATSREALKADGEYVYRVASLDVPAEENQDVEDVLRHGALQLFDARVASVAGAGRSEDPRVVALKARICRQLDGIPLAIELAAARVRVFGIEGVAERIDDRFNLLTGGARTALPRQKTLRATLDWSYELLSAPEREVLGRLSVFGGPFSIDAAAAVASSAEIPPDAVVDCLSQLVEKSLVATDASSAVQYRLLETTQVYAREKMAANAALREYQRRHARYHCELLMRAEAEWETRPTVEWIATFGRYLADLRAAINWSFSPEGSPALGVALTTSSVPLWMHLALLEECLARVDEAMAHLDRRRIVDDRSRMKLCAAKAASLLYQGVGLETGAAFQRALELAERLGEPEYMLRATWGLWGVSYLNGKYEASLALARRFSELSATLPHQADRLIGERMAGMSLLCLGRLADARDRLERMAALYAAPDYRSHLIRFIYEQKVIAQTSLAHTLWLQGFADQALRVVQQATAGARAIDHPPSVCYVLTEGVCAIALLTGGVAALAQPAASAIEATRRHGVSTWKARGRMWRGLLLLGRGDADAHARDLRPAFEEIGEALFVLHYTGYVSAACMELGLQGQVPEGLALIDAAIGRARQVDDRCSIAELLRVKGELLDREPASKDQAEAQFIEAVEASRQQESLAWKLRCATSLARAWLQQGRRVEARELLAPVYAQFTEGFDTADLQQARVLLGSMR